jgi:hypothetical protein
VQLGPIEVGVVVATVAVLYAFVRSEELLQACLGAYHSFLGAMRGDRAGPTPG